MKHPELMRLVVMCILHVAWSHLITESNIVFIKPHKVGGSTAGGVFRRIANKHGLSGWETSNWVKKEPGIWANHGKRSLMEHRIARLNMPSFVVTWVRKPVTRCLSWFYHRRMTRDEGKLSDSRLRDFVETQCYPVHNEIETKKKASAQQTVNSYDFIGLTERFTESMLVIAYHFDLSIGDILFVRAKDSHELKIDKAGRKWVPNAGYASQTASSQAMLDKFNATSHMDNLIWTMANNKLDNAIKKLPCFRENLALYRLVLSMVSNQCPHQDDCYWRDNGCGLTCMDAIWKNFTWFTGEQSIRVCSRV